MPSIKYGFERPENRDYKKRLIENDIIEINNKLLDLCELLKLDIHDIKRIPLNNHDNTIKKESSTSKVSPPFANSWQDNEKRAIVASIVSNELQESIRRESARAVGITDEEYEHYSNERVIKDMDKTAHDFYEKNFNERIYNEDNKRMIEQYKLNLTNKKSDKPKGEAPPKTNWEILSLEKSEKDKILASIRANPKSSVFSPEFKWNPEDFLKAFKFLESPEKYNGPFLVSILSNKSDLEKYSNIESISEGVKKISIGKYVLLSMYDITSQNKNPQEAKYIYMGLSFDGMTGTLIFDKVGAISGIINNSQKILIKEFMDCMNITYNAQNESLKLSYL